ncbi:MAG: nucleotide sugar dehydrogenase [Elusimicrobiaceae bacterium]|nr:nucleotide sugar dehydrogenase [Elusimicrobiaceae bacterium]
MRNFPELAATKKAAVGIIGQGYVGLPLAVEFARAGFKVTGFEVDLKKVAGLNAGKSYVDDIADDTLSPLVQSGALRCTGDFSELAAQDAIIICVPTPLRKSKDPDVSYIVAAVESVRKYLRRGQLIILESTTYPGTTTELVRPMLEETGFKTGRDFYLAFSPERVDPGNPDYGIINTPKVVGGETAACTEYAAALYGAVVERVLKVSNTRAAELVKLLENTFRAVNIGMVNEFALMCDRLGLNVWEILDAAATKPFGYMPFYPGPGIGGHCIPLDPHYLGWKMKTLNFEPRFIELAGTINSTMPAYVVNRVYRMLNEAGKCLSGSAILVMGVTYKADISDPRESPALDVISLLGKTGARVDYHDRYVREFAVAGKKLVSKKLSAAMLAKYDCVVILTAHKCVDYRELVRHSALVFDTRNAAKGIRSKKIVRL